MWTQCMLWGLKYISMKSSKRPGSAWRRWAKATVKLRRYTTLKKSFFLYGILRFIADFCVFLFIRGGVLVLLF